MLESNKQELRTSTSSFEVQFDRMIYPLIETKLNLIFEELKKTSYHLPLVVTNEDLKREFQISDSTLNRLMKLGGFPKCWYGIRGHYPREKVIEWFEKYDYTEYKDTIKSLRMM